MPEPAGPGSTFAIHVADLVLDEGVLDPATVLEGSPRVTEALLWSSADGRVLRGVWEITEGTVIDVEQDEVFIVVHGRATIEVEGGETSEVGPGDMAVLARGARTRWTVHETLRKVYQITLPDVSG
ncbi:MAG: cupin domain-containing protein [Actinomycetota bacterium]